MFSVIFQGFSRKKKPSKWYYTVSLYAMEVAKNWTRKERTNVLLFENKYYVTFLIFVPSSPIVKEWSAQTARKAFNQRKRILDTFNDNTSYIILLHLEHIYSSIYNLLLSCCIVESSKMGLFEACSNLIVSFTVQSLYKMT